MKLQKLSCVLADYKEFQGHVIDAFLNRRDMLINQLTDSGIFVISLEIFIIISVDIFVVYTLVSALPQPKVIKDIRYPSHSGV